MAVGRPEDITLDTVVHRVGGGHLDNLRVSPLEENLTPPGISVLLGGIPQEAAEQLRQAFPRSRKWRETAYMVGTTTAMAIRQAGFEIVPDPTNRFPNHARLIHPDDAEGFTDENLERLSQAFQNTTEC